MNYPLGIDVLAHRRNRALNALNTWLLAAGSLLLLAAVAWAFAGGVGIVYAIVFGSVSLWLVNRISPKMVLSMYKARPIDRREFPTGVEILEELASRAGLPAVPSLHLIPSRMMNAFAVGRRDDAAIAVTDALIRNLTVREFAAVLAHEISHIANEDVKVMAFADMVSRFTSIMSTVGIFSLTLNILGIASGYDAELVPWTAVVILVFAPTLGALLQLALSRTREFGADLDAAMLTGDPDGLASALWKLERAQGRLWESVFLPGGRIPDPSVLRTHPPTKDRVARLMELKAARDLPEPPATMAADSVGRVRRSFVPRIRRIDLEPDEYRRIASRMVAQAPLGAADQQFPQGSFPAPGGRPRIRITRGGVWW